jgi:hypothetical protein
MTDDAPGVDAWKRNTSAFDRVQSVASTVSEPQPAAAIADEARVAENTARDHLERLAEMNVLLKTDDGGTTTYAPDPLDLKVDLQEQIETWQDSHGVRSPEELREQAADTDDAATTREIQATAREWELVDYRLDIVEDAIANYSTYTRPDQASA